MKKLFLLLFLAGALTVQAQQEIYSKVKVSLSAEQTAFRLSRLGFDITHGDYAPAKHFTSVFSQSEIARITAAGFRTEILVPDMKAQYLAGGPVVAEGRDEDCNTDGSSPYDQYETPENYTYGSMGGYHTYAELLAVLDNMAELYPNLISEKTPVPGALTHEGNEIYYLRLSDNPTTDEDTEPEVLYTAVHHAREPNSASQMIFFLWYMLENYEDDAEVQNLINNVEMYFIPVVNPDGYLYNEETDPEGGGFWRKNRRDNGDGTFGVDLNRNYGYEWGINDVGSSPNTNSNVYRGPAPFSEPETSAVRDFCNAHEFQIAHNYHTFGNLLIHPWGYDDSPTPDDELFKAIAEEMTVQNDFVYGTGIETVGYNVNGVSDDWMYGEQTTKPKIYAYTPEVGSGNFGFWPTQAQIDPFNKSCMYLNLATANLVLNYGQVKDLTGDLLETTENTLDFEISRLGFQEGALTVSLTAVSDNVIVIGEPQVFNLNQNETANGSLAYVLDGDIASSETVEFILSVDNGVFAAEQNLTKTYFIAETTFADDASDLENWSSQVWNTTTSEFVSAPSSITDSPDGNYANNSLSFLTMEEEVDLGTAEAAFLSFWARWDIENDYDYTQIQISVNGGPYVPMCGNFTNEGVSAQDGAEGEPLYDDVQLEWVQEKIDLSEYLTAGEQHSIRLRWLLYSDGGVRADGFYFDDMEILTPDMTSDVDNFTAKNFTVEAAPNPAKSYTVLTFSEAVQDGNLRLTEVTGKMLREVKFSGDSYRLNVADLAAGIYFYEVSVNGETFAAQKLTVK